MPCGRLVVYSRHPHRTNVSDAAESFMQTVSCALATALPLTCAVSPSIPDGASALPFLCHSSLPPRRTDWKGSGGGGSCHTNREGVCGGSAPPLPHPSLWTVHQRTAPASGDKCSAEAGPIAIPRQTDPEGTHAFQPRSVPPTCLMSADRAPPPAGDDVVRPCFRPNRTVPRDPPVVTHPPPQVVASFWRPFSCGAKAGHSCCSAGFRGWRVWVAGLLSEGRGKVARPIPHWQATATWATLNATLRDTAQELGELRGALRSRVALMRSPPPSCVRVVVSNMRISTGLL